MVEYTKINRKLTNVQLNKLKKSVKSDEGATLRLGIKHFNKDELPHELLLTTRQNTKLRNAINNNLTTDIKLSKAQIKKLIQSEGFLGTLSIASYASVVGIPAGIRGASLTLVFTIGTGISKSLLKLTKKRKKKHNKIIVLSKNKLNMIDTLLSSALNDCEISHEEFTNIINEANIYENIKEI